MEWALKRFPQVIEALFAIPLGGSPLSGIFAASKSDPRTAPPRTKNPRNSPHDPHHPRTFPLSPTGRKIHGL